MGGDAAIWLLLAAAVVVLATKLIIALPQLGVFWAGFSPLERVLLWRGCLYQDLTLIAGLFALVLIAREAQRRGPSPLGVIACASCLAVTLYTLGAFLYWQLFYTFPNRSALRLASGAAPLLESTGEVLRSPDVVKLVVLAATVHLWALRGTLVGSLAGAPAARLLKLGIALLGVAAPLILTGWGAPDLPVPNCLVVNPVLALADARAGSIALDRLRHEPGPEASLGGGGELRHRPARFRESPDVILILWESAGAWALQPYATRSPWASLLARGGHANGIGAPRLFARPDRTAVFDNVYANTVCSFTSQTTLLTGRYTPMTLHNWGTVASGADLPRVLGGHGYRTGCFSSSHLTFSGRLQQLQQTGFDVVDRPRRSGSRYVYNPWGVDDRRVFDKVRAFLTESDRPAFALGVTVGSHYPYTHAVPGQPDDPDPARRYLAAMAFDAELIADLADWLETRKRPSILLVVGDHGEAFGQHEHNVGHASSLAEENVHVPCVLIASGRAGLPERISTLGSILDVAPTVLDMLDLPGRPEHEGKSLLTARTEDCAIQALPIFDPMLAVRHDRWKFVLRPVSGRSALFDLALDPAESRDLSRVLPERRRAYHNLLATWAARQREN